MWGMGTYRTFVHIRGEVVEAKLQVYILVVYVIQECMNNAVEQNTILFMIIQINHGQ